MATQMMFCTRSIAHCVIVSTALLWPVAVSAQAPSAEAPAAAPAKKPPAKSAAPSTPKTSGPSGYPTRIPPPGPAEVPLFGARPFIDQRSGIAMTIPAGWLLLEAPQSADTEISRMIMDGPGQPSPSCGVVVLKANQPPNITQAQVNKAIHDDRNVDNIKKNVARGKSKLVSVQKLTASGVSGIFVQVLSPGSAASPDTTTYLAFYEALGRRYSLNCNVLTQDLDTMRPDIEAIVKSIRLPNS